MTIASKVRLIRDNLLIGTHVYRAGDVVEVHSERARDMVKHGLAAVASPDEPVTPAGKPRLRSEVLAENAAAQTAPARAERAERRPKVAVG